MYKLSAVNHSNGFRFVRFIKHCPSLEKCRRRLTECQCRRRTNRRGNASDIAIDTQREREREREKRRFTRRIFELKAGYPLS